MDSTRQNKFAKLIQKELTEIFLRDGRNYYGNAFVTITSLKVTPDLGEAKIYLSIYGNPNPQAKVDEVNHHAKEIRRDLGNSIRNQIRRIPELKFFLDDTLEYVEKMEKIFKDLHDSVLPPFDSAQGQTPPAGDNK